MKVPIYSQDEMHDRFRLRNFLYEHFTFYKDASNHFHLGITPEDLADIYGAQYDTTILSQKMICHFLEVSGYLMHPDVVYCDIKLEAFYKLNDNVKLRLINLVDPRIAVTLTQVSVHKEVPQEYVLQARGVEFIKLFLKHMVFEADYTTPFHFKDVKEVAGCAPLAELYKYYMDYCVHNDVNFVSKKLFVVELKKYGYETVKGYCNGRSGIQYYHKLVMPTTEEDLRLSIENCCGIVTIRPEYLKVVPDYVIKSEEDLPILIRVGKQNRKECAQYEQGATSATKETEEETVVDRGTDEATASNVSEGTERTETEEYIRNTVRVYADNQEVVEVPEVQVPNFEGTEYASQYEGEWNGDEDESSDSDTDYDDSDDYEDEFTEDDDTDSGYEDIEDGTEPIDDEFGGDVSTDSEELPTIEDIIQALKVPYTMDKDNFNEETLEFYLGIMNAPEEYYNDLPGLLQKLKEA